MIVKEGIAVFMRGCALAMALSAVTATQAVAADAADEEEAAPDFWRINVGVRGWYTDWTSWATLAVDETNTGGPGTVATSEDAAKAKLVLIPQLSVQVKDFVLSTSYFTSTKYQIIGEAERKEYDVNAGYSVMPGLALSVGYKSIKQSFGVFGVKLTGPTVGFSGSAPLSYNFGIYANFAYGQFDAKFTDGGSSDASYLLAEPGLSYVVPVNDALGLDAVVLTLGYRFQSAKIKDGSVTDNLFDNTRGLSFGVSASF